MNQQPAKELKRVLFVDDEQNVLEGLQRMLRPMRREWEMSFAADGPAALALSAERTFDVIVTDMRMPGMDGAQLLAEVMRLYPRTVRIILSGHSDHDMIMKSVGAAHQFLAKPCDPDVVKETICRACALRELLTNGNLELLVSEMKSLPSVPSLYMELMKELEASEPSIKNVSQIISRDPGMTAKILQLVNSAFFGLRRRISSAADAVSLLGLDTTKTLVLSIRIFSEFEAACARQLPVEEIWSHSLRVAALAQAIARAETSNTELAQAAFTAGLLHEVGRLILADRLGDRYRQVMAAIECDPIPVAMAERNVFGAAHPEVGAYLLGLWGLPNSIVEAVAFYDNPSNSNATHFDALTAVHIADCLVSAETRPGATTFDMPYLETAGVAGNKATWEYLQHSLSPAE
jgi:HD-like signal output (HDOD) protein